MPADGMFGEYVRGRREELGLNLTETAEAAGLSIAAISRIEHGTRTELRPVTIIKLARALQVDAGELFNRLPCGTAA